MKLRRVVAVAIGALGISLGVALPAQAAVTSIISQPSSGQHFTQGQGASINATCVQNGAGAVVQSCQLSVNDSGGSNVFFQDFGGGSDVVSANASLPTGSVGHFIVGLATRGTGGGFDETTVDYYVDPQPADPPSASISGPGAGTAVNPGTPLNLSSSCSAGARANLTNCDADVTYPDGGHSGLSGFGGSLPTDASGDYNVTVTARQSDGQTASASTWYRVNTPPRVVLTNPVNGGVVNQGDFQPWGGQCITGSAHINTCDITITDPNGNAAFVNGNAAPTAVVGIYHVHLFARDDNGLTASMDASYRVNEYPKVAISSPLQGLRVYTDTPVPASYACTDHEGPVVSCAAPFPNGANVDTSPAGPKSFNVTATDSDGAKTSKTVTYNVYDKPTAHINGPAVNTVVNPGGAAPTFLGNCAGGVPDVICTMTVTAPDGTVTDVTSGQTLPIAQYGSYKLTVHVIDDFKTEQTATRYYKVNEAPHIVILTPEPGIPTYFQGQNVVPNYSCYDNDHDGTITDDSIASCTAPAGPLATQDTPVGLYTYTVKAVDNDGAPTSQTVSYKVVPVVGPCQGTGLRLLNNSFGVSGTADPCATSDSVVINAKAPLGDAAPSLLSTTGVVANVIEGHTVRTKPATFFARADVADTTINVLGTVNLKVTGVHSTAQSTLLTCSTAQLTGTSTVGTLVLNGAPIQVGSQPLTIPLAVGTLYLNQKVVSGTGITERAVFLDLPGTALDVVIGESTVAPRCGTL